MPTADFDQITQKPKLKNTNSTLIFNRLIFFSSRSTLRRTSIECALIKINVVLVLARYRIRTGKTTKLKEINSTV